MAEREGVSRPPAPAAVAKAIAEEFELYKAEQARKKAAA
ncbi:hypothetical protein ABIF69_003863 [Bradyrhizobium japonicum]